jgi:hypothetical protein
MGVKQVFGMAFFQRFAAFLKVAFRSRLGYQASADMAAA